MALLRSRRLETLLGSPLETLTYGDVAGLAQTACPEASDLDYKRTLYDGSDKGRHDLASDVAALANAHGGLIVVGMDEDDGHASVAVGVPLSDAETNRIHTIVAAQVAPVPRIEIHLLPNPDRPGSGLLLIEVESNAAGPHAVVVNRTSLRYPRRVGRITVFLPEHEVAAAYRDRFTGLQTRADELTAVATNLAGRLDTGAAYLTVALVPDRPGYMPIDAASFRTFQRALTGQDPHVLPRGISWQAFQVVPGAFLASVTTTDERVAVTGVASLLHSTGAGAFATAVGGDSSTPSATDAVLIDDEALINGMFSGLTFLAAHARYRTATGGTCTVRAALHPADVPMRLTNGRHRGLQPHAGHRAMSAQAATATGVGDIDELADSGPLMVATAHQLASTLLQAFGVPECFQTTPDGQLRMPYWNDRTNALRTWADKVSVDCLEKTVT